MFYDSRENFLSFLLVDYIFLNDLLAGPHSKECLRKIGVKYSFREIGRASCRERV